MSVNKCLPADMPVGFRFEPKEEEICCHYLWLKTMGKDSEVDHVIAEVDFGDSDPWDLPAKSRIKSDDQIWWFFCRQEIGKTNRRTTKSGYWKITGKERKINARDTKICIGKKKIVVFLMGKSNAGRKTNWVIHEYHPLVQNPQWPYIICRLEKKTDKKDATPSCDVGEPSGSAGVANISDIENPVAPSAISKVLGHAEVKKTALLSQPLLSSDWRLPEEDVLYLSELSDWRLPEEDVLYLSELSDDDHPKNNCVMDEKQLEPQNSLPHQGPHDISSFENKTDEMGGTSGCFIGKPSGNIPFDIEDQVAPDAIQEVHGLAEVNSETENSMIFSNSFNDGHNMMQVQCRADEPEDSSAEFLDGLIVDPYENDCGKTTKNRFNNSIQPKSLKRLCFPDGPANVDTNVEGVDGRVKRFRSFALGEQPRWPMNR